MLCAEYSRLVTQPMGGNFAGQGELKAYTGPGVGGGPSPTEIRI
jgi:hypothetical protein